MYFVTFDILVGKSKSHSRKSSQSSSNNNGPPSKRMKSNSKDVLAEAGKHGGYSELALFDKVQDSILMCRCTCISGITSVYHDTSIYYTFMMVYNTCIVLCTHTCIHCHWFFCLISLDSEVP